MFRIILSISFLAFCFILANVPSALCSSSIPIIYVAGDSSGDYNCAGNSDQLQINQALQFVAKNSAYTTVHLKGPNTYVIDDTILIGSNTILEGDPTAVIKLANHTGWPTMKPLIQQMNDSGDSNITIRGFEVNVNYEGNSEIILGRGFYNVMYFTNCNNVNVYNMYMHDGTGDGLRINKGKNVRFYNNTIYKLGHDALFAIRCDNVEAWNNRVTCRTNGALRIWNSNNVKLHDNIIDSFYHWSAGGPGIQLERSETYVMDNIDVYNNTIHNTYGPGIWIVTHDTNNSTTQDMGKDIHIHHNIFYNTGTNPSITWVGGIIASGFQDTLIENNVFDGCYGAAIAHMFTADYVPEGGFTTIVRNNIIINTQKRSKDSTGTGCGIANYLPGSHFFVIDNDCFYNNSGGDYKNCASTTDLYVNPLVANSKNHDYHLQSKNGRWDRNTWVKDKVSSLCIDAGYRFSDYFNEPEPNGKRVNIGPDGNTKYASKSDMVTPLILPTSNFSSNVTSGYAPLTVWFRDLSSNASSWKWNFGDNTSSTLQTPTHTYSAAGNYTVILTVSNSNGSDSKTGNISVLNKENLPNLPIKYTNRLRESSPGNVFSNNTFLDVGGMSGVGRFRDVILFDMNGFSHDTKINSATLSLTWYYPSKPRLNDTVIEIYRPASLWNPNSVSWNKRDNNIPWSNKGGDWYDKNGILNGGTPYATLTLQKNSTPNNTSCEFNVTNLVREFTSGKYSNTGFLIKARTESDNYIAFYSDNCKLFVSSSMLPTANFSSSVPGGYAPLSVQFDDLSKNATKWEWDFGDNTRSTQQSPMHTYSGAGNFTVNLTVSNANGTDSKFAMISIQKSMPGIIWSNPANITYGTALGGRQLNAYATIVGAFNYTPGTGTILSAGKQLLHVDFTPTDIANYTIASKNVSIDVSRAAPAITWNNPSGIASGTALGSAQLDAFSTIPGSFAYTPKEGTVLSAGVKTLHVDFIPADTVNYTNTSKNVLIKVLEKPVIPSANFSINVTSGPFPLFVQFTDLSENASSRTWDFGDSTNSTQKNPVHAYSEVGNYSVVLTVSNENGTDSMKGNINVFKKVSVSNLSVVYNNRLREASPEDVLSTSLFLDIGEMSGVGRYRDVIWFDLSEYKNKQISNATLSLFWYYPGNSRLKDTIVEIYRPASFWNSSYVSWNTKNRGIAWSKPGGEWYDYNEVSQGSIPYASLTLRASELPGNSYYEFDITDLVKEYVEGKYSNTGFFIKARNESDNYVAFYSAQIGNSNKAPKLKLVYN